MSNNKSLWCNYIFIFASFALIIFLYTRFSSYPYYFQFDTDATVAIDTLLINSNKLPDHVQHPSYGMYIFFSLASEAGKYLNIVAISNLNDLKQCLNATTCMAEFTQYLRSFSPFVAASVSVMLVLAFSALFKNDRAYLIIMAPVTLLFFFEETLRYNSIIIKSEIYSTFFWAAAVLVLSISRKLEKSWYAVILTLAGLLAGLCLTTKVQFLFYVASLYIFFFLINSMGLAANNIKQRNFSLRGLLLVNIITALLLITSFYQASKFSFEIGFSNTIGIVDETGGVKIGHLNSFGYLLVTYVFAVLGINIFMILKKRNAGVMVNTLLNTAFINLGLVGSFYIALTLSGYVDKPLDLMSQALRMLFFRETGSLTPSLSNYATYMSDFVASRSWFYICCATISIGAIVVSIRSLANQREERANNIVTLALLFILFILVVANFYFAVRPILHDLIIAKILIIFFVLIMVKVAIEFQGIAGIKFIREISAVLLGALMLINAPYCFTIEKTISAENSHYGWSEYHWLNGVYDANQKLYKQIMYDSVDAQVNTGGISWENSRMGARNLSKNKEILKSIFINQDVNTSLISYVAPHARIYKNSDGSNIKKSPWFLADNLLYSNANLSTVRSRLLPGKFYEIPGYHLYAFDQIKEKPSLDNTLGILTRNDYKIRIFQLRGGGKTKSLPPEFTPLPGEEIELDNGEIYDGFLVTTYTEFNLELENNKFFFVITLN